MPDEKGKTTTKEEGGKSVPVRREPMHPMMTLWDRMNRLFADTFAGFDLAPIESWPRLLGGFTPAVNVVENGKEVHVTAELPGLDEAQAAHKKIEVKAK